MLGQLSQILDLQFERFGDQPIHRQKERVCLHLRARKMLANEKLIVRGQPLIEIRAGHFEILGPVVVQNHRTLARNRRPIVRAPRQLRRTGRRQHSRKHFPSIWCHR